jgi:hypothetical protein
MSFLGTEKSGNWTLESCSTVGTGQLNLTGADFGYTTFQNSHGNGEVWYSITDGDNREAGSGTLIGGVITRDRVTATLVNGDYTTGVDLPPISLSGSATVAGTFNAASFNTLWRHIWDTENPHDVIAEQVTLDTSNLKFITSDNVQGAIEEIDAALEAATGEFFAEISEVISADNQTLFTTPIYIVGTNRLAVFINGVRQAPTAYTELSTTSIEFTSGLAAGDLVMFEARN